MAFTIVFYVITLFICLLIFNAARAESTTIEFRERVVIVTMQLSTLYVIVYATIELVKIFGWIN